jgi:O-antigen ligase
LAEGDVFVRVKWDVLELITVVTLVGDVAATRRSPVPRFTGHRAWLLVALAGLTLFSALRAGIGSSIEPLLARSVLVALVLGMYVHFSRSRLGPDQIVAGLTISLTVVTAIGLAQITGLTRALRLEPLFGLTGADGRSATFGNANMAAQFVGFAVTFLLATRATAEDAGRRATRRAQDALLAAALVYLVLLGSRSAQLGVGLAFLVVATHAAARGRSARRRALLVISIVAVALVAATIGTWQKAQSLHLRLALLQQTVRLIRDHPLGVGSGNFLHAFLPYQLGDDRLRSETVVYGSPHNELLRALAEEGVVWTALALYLLLRLGLAVRRRARAEGWPAPAVVVAASAAFLIVESLFQFPFAMALGCLAAAVVLGLALAYVAPPDPDAPLRRATVGWRVGAGMAAAAVAAATLWLAASDVLASRAMDARAQGRACDLDPRNVGACLRAAWLEAQAGHRRRARSRLAALLDRSPYYYPAIKLLGDESLARGDARAGCFHLWVYDALFAERSSIHATVSSACDPRWIEAFRRHTIVPGYERFPFAVPAGE